MIYEKSYLRLIVLFASVGPEAKQKTKPEKNDMKTEKLDMKTNADEKDMKATMAKKGEMTLKNSEKIESRPKRKM